MIAEFIKQYYLPEHQEVLRRKIKDHHPSYSELVKYVVEAVRSDDDSDWDGQPAPNRIHEIDDGDYQGTILFVIAADNYQPSEYWYTMVSYGSCSGCDTLQAIRDGYPYDYDDEDEEVVTPSQVDGYLQLTLHILQGMKKLGDD